MKPTLLFAMLSLVFAVPQASAATELETLRARCNEQERQIRRLEEEVQKMRSGDTPAAAAKTTMVSDVTHSPAATSYTVRSGECLEGIARKTGCSATKLAKTNGLKVSSIIHPGQKLKLPGSAVVKSSPSEAPTARPAAPASSVAGKTYKLQQGETYASISRKTRIPVASLIAANPGIKPTELRPGQVIHLSTGGTVATPAVTPVAPAKHETAVAAAAPVRSGTVASTPEKPAVPARKPEPATSAPVSAPRPAASAPKNSTPLTSSKTIPVSTPTHSTPEATGSGSSQNQTLSPTNPEKKIRSVTIEGEMTYGEFATQHGTDTSRLNDLNGLDLTNATVLAKGSELYVPAQP